MVSALPPPPPPPPLHHLHLHLHHLHLHLPTSGYQEQGKTWLDDALDEFTEYDTGGVCALDRGDFERLVIATFDDDDARDNLAKGTQGAKARLERIFHKADLDGTAPSISTSSSRTAPPRPPPPRSPPRAPRRASAKVDGRDRALDSAVDVLGSLDLINRADALLQAEESRAPTTTATTPRMTAT